MIPSRRSTRIQDANAHTSTEPPKPTATETRSARKRKVSANDQEPEDSTKGKKRATAGKANAKSVKSSNKTNTKTNAKAKNKSTGSNKAPTTPESPAPDDALSILPAEILEMILENVTGAQNLLELALTSRRYYSYVMPVLHKRIAVMVQFWTHIAHVIRRIEPHLSIAQKKQLKKEGKYKGQQDRFSTRLDPDSVPSCVGYVRQMVIGRINPGQRHKYILIRYFEEVLKNLNNLEIVETTELTKSMSQNIVSQKNLKALHLKPNSSWEDEARTLLAKIKNLQHLTVASGLNGTLVTSDENILQSILLNSMSTLQSLDIRTNKWRCDFLADWEDQIKARNPETLKQPHDFTALRSLTLWGMTFDARYAERMMPNLTRAFDFLALRELNLSNLDESKVTFFNYLEALFSSADKSEIHLRLLSVQMNGNRLRQDYQQTESQLECVYRFISSFDTLTSLRIDDYNIYNSVVETYPGISTSLQQAILKHKDLEKLQFHYGTTGGSDHRIPYVSASTVALFTKSLPGLQVFEFPPQETDFDEMARALSQAKNLTTLTCAPYASQHDRSQGDISFTLAKTILEGFLTNTTSTSEFVWEDNYKLTRLAMGRRREFKIGSELKPGENLEDPVIISKGESAVMCQKLAGKSDPDRYWIPDTEWVKTVAKCYR